LWRDAPCLFVEGWREAGLRRLLERPTVWLVIGGFGPVRSSRTFEAVVEQISEAIRTGELRRGERLPSERALSLRLEVSRPTLREAIKVLAQAGIVQVLPGPKGGTFVVSEVIPASLVDRTASRLGEVPAVLEARRAFEPAVARLAAKHGTPGDFMAMERIVALQWEAGDDWARITQLDNRFHREMARATKNAVIVSMMSSLSRQLEIARATRMRTPFAIERAVAVNGETVEAIRSGDESEIERVMDEHLKQLEEAWGKTRKRRRSPG
jgi:GntR family transcriptional repressor for pyruvate dehydrogenase complex